MALALPDVVVGGLSRSDLLSALAAAGVRLNRSAEILMASDVFDTAHQEVVHPVVRTVDELGLAGEASLSRILATAQSLGLRLCPPTTAPYLRLALLHQPSAPDSVLTNGRAPTGSLTVSAAPLRADGDYPKGFYLRVIDEVPWLRGYQCTDEHLWSPEDRLVFDAGASGPRPTGLEP